VLQFYKKLSKDDSFKEKSAKSKKKNILEKEEERRDNKMEYAD
jgi:hypothetical protein